MLFYAVVCWGTVVTEGGRNRINKLVKKAGSIIGLKLDSLEAITEQRIRIKTEAILRYDDHPLHAAGMELRSGYTDCLVMSRYSTECFRSSFLPAAIRYFSDCKANGRKK